ncbi:MAG: 30S ribosomal protein S5 [Candidatus Woesearchaeota archaeon]
MKINEEKIVDVPMEDEKIVEEVPEQTEIVEEVVWEPKTELGKKVKNGEITSLRSLLESGVRILEPEIVDFLEPNLQIDFIKAGQAKGKFGGGKRIIFKKVQHKSGEGNKQEFVALAVVGNGKGIVGMGLAKASDNKPAREKAIRQAKLNLIALPFGCGSWECNCGGTHSIPFAVYGRCGSARVYLYPAPKGTGFVVDNEVAKILKLAGYTDVRGKVYGSSRHKINVIKATFNALKKLSQVKMHQSYVSKIKVN